MTSSKAEATVRPGSSTTMPPATMNANSAELTGSSPAAPSEKAPQAMTVAIRPPIAHW